MFVRVCVCVCVCVFENARREGGLDYVLHIREKCEGKGKK